jgi:hypothetical protein
MNCDTTYTTIRISLSSRWGDPEECKAREIEGLACVSITYVAVGRPREVRRKDEMIGVLETEYLKQEKLIVVAIIGSHLVSLEESKQLVTIRAMVTKSLMVMCI